jgi:hypothetical protein
MSTHLGKYIGISSSSVLTQTEIPKTGIAQLRGSVSDNSGQPIEGASVSIHKSERMVNSADMQGGYTAFTSSDKYGIYSFSQIPSGVYDTKITYQDELVSKIENYVVWPSSNSSFNFVKYPSQ